MLEIDQRPSIRLHMKGCCNGDMWVNTGFPAPHVMFLHRGWKTFTRAHFLMKGHVLLFKLVENDLLSVRIFGCSGHRLWCREESLTDDESSSSSDGDEGGGTGGEDDEDGSD